MTNTVTVPPFNASTHIPVMEMFYTIQGEGYHTGRAAFFIRLAGCDVGCHWCDVKESWTINPNQIVTISSIVEQAKSFPSRFVVITGGEPAMHDLSALTAALKHEGFEIAIETSGSSPLTGTIDWICLSPKKFKQPLDEYFNKANELKIIVFNQHDLEWAEELAKKVKTTTLLYLQPEWDKQNTMMEKIIDHVKCNPKWKISLQTHKFLNIP
jgi:organic radical activating enzyme